jgi:hypothetical protein
MKGILYPSADSKKRLTCEWKFQKDKFSILAKQLKTELGEEWFKFFTQLYELIGK